MPNNVEKVIPTPYAYQLLNELNAKDSNPSDSIIDANIWDDFVNKAQLNEFSDVKMGYDISLDDAYKCLVPNGNEVTTPDLNRFMIRRADESKTEVKDERFLGFLWKNGRKTVTKYDSEGRIISKTTRNKYGLKKVTQYDVDGNIIFNYRHPFFRLNAVGGIYDINGEKLPEVGSDGNREDHYAAYGSALGTPYKVEYKHGAEKTGLYNFTDGGAEIYKQTGAINPSKSVRGINLSTMYQDGKIVAYYETEQYGKYYMETKYDAEHNVVSRKVKGPDVDTN